MNKYQEDKLSMYLAVKSACDKHQAAWNSLPAFATNYAAFIAEVEAIEAAGGIQGAGTTGARIDKFARRDTMTSLSVQIGNAVEAYALLSDNASLAERVAVNPTILQRARDTEAAQIATRIRDEAQAIGAPLIPYGVDAAALTSLSAAITAYKALLTAPRDAIITRKAAGETLRTAFPNADRLLTDALDKLVPLLAAQTPLFGIDYRNARIIVNSATRSEAEEEEEGEGEGEATGGDGTPIE